jgi:hypothetical protein
MSGPGERDFDFLADTGRGKKFEHAGWVVVPCHKIEVFGGLVMVKV